MIPTDSTTWQKLSLSSSYDQNYSNSKPGYDNCAICGKAVADKGPKTAWIEHTTSGLLIPAGVEVPVEGEGNYQGHESQGMFPVGPECAKKLRGYVRYHDPKEFSSSLMEETK